MEDIKSYSKQNKLFLSQTRMHSSRMRTARSLTVSHCKKKTEKNHARPPHGKIHACPPEKITHAPPQKIKHPPEKSYACPPEKLCTPRKIMHAPPEKNYAPPQKSRTPQKKLRTPPETTMHATSPPCEQNS